MSEPNGCLLILAKLLYPEKRYKHKYKSDIRTVISKKAIPEKQEEKLPTLKPSEKDKKPEAVKLFPYKRKYLLSKAELSFYKVLDKAIQSELEIITKVRLEDIIATDRETEEYQKYRNKISSKHLDFVLCKPENMYVYAAIELDDSSHEREDRQERDEFVGEALKTAGIPLIRFKCQRSYSESEIRNIIQEAVKGYY